MDAKDWHAVTLSYRVGQVTRPFSASRYLTIVLILAVLLYIPYLCAVFSQEEIKANPFRRLSSPTLALDFNLRPDTHPAARSGGRLESGNG
jgi:hypothetical protein